MDIKKTYEPQDIEKKWYEEWIKKEYFKPQKDKDKEPYTILIPPPNVTGILHMGHVLNNTLQDVMVRYKRMTGVPTLWLPGVDHAGIATQNVVEKELLKEDKTRYDIGREKMIEKIWQWKDEKGGRIIEQLKQLGASCDWSRQRFTMDKVLSRAVKEVFVQLYEKGLIYRGKRIINWCPRCQTALSNDEVEHEEQEGKLWHIKYPLKDKEGFVVVATTRPETMLGDTAVAVHPEDDRYKDIIGLKLQLPLTDREIPVIADAHVDKDFGSGCVKVTPSHDPNDFDIGERHNLEKITVMDSEAKMNKAAGEEFIGMDRIEARLKIIKMLEKRNLLLNIESHEHAVGQCYRCDTVIEPYLSDQWFVKMKPLAKPAIKVVKEGKIKFQPGRWEKVYYHWMENIRDWCISRQIWWGHRIPAYYCQNCDEITVAKKTPDQCSKCGSNNLKQEEDVLDTWFSSWLWPFSTMGWPEKTEDLDYFLPTNLLITAPGIIYLWVARMIMATLEFEDKIPFKTVLLHGMVLDETGTKMSKSLGNSPDPIHIIEKYGADALRFSIIFNTPKGEDSYYSEKILETGRNFANKIWNAYRFVMMNAEKIEGLPTKEELKLELADKWIYSRLNEVVKESKKHYESLRLNDAASLLMDFIWNEYCSWYLELAKERIYSEDKSEQKTAKYILLDILQKSMRILQPIMPFITEEIFQNIKRFFPIEEDSIVIAKYPEVDRDKIDAKINTEMKLVKETIKAIRNLRRQVNLSPAREVKAVIRIAFDAQKELFTSYKNYFKNLAKVTTMQLGKNIKNPANSVAAVVQNIEVFLPLKGLIDLDKEREKLTSRIDKLKKELQGIKKKLDNESFLTKAPQKIVEKEKEKYKEVKTKVEKNLKILKGLGN